MKRQQASESPDAIDPNTIQPLNPSSDEDDMIARVDMALNADRTLRRVSYAVAGLSAKERAVLAKRFGR